MTQLRSVTCHMGSHSVTCYPTQVNTLRLHPSQTGWYSIYRPFQGGGLSKPRPSVQRATGPLLLRDSPRPARPEPITYRSLVEHANHQAIASQLIEREIDEEQRWFTSRILVARLVRSWATCQVIQVRRSTFSYDGAFGFFCRASPQQQQQQQQQAEQAQRY